MSYNTRRSGSGFAPSPNAVGQRRPASSVPTQGHQQATSYQSQLSAQNKPPTPQQNLQQQQQVQRPPQQSNMNMGYRTQPVQQPQQVSAQSQQHQVQQQQQQSQMPQQQIQKTIVQTVTLKKEEPPVAMEADNISEAGSTAQRKRPAWMTKGSKLPKRERQRRRNIKLRKLLQPKNALMILNELVKSTTFTVDELPVPVDGCMYEATVVIDNIEMKGVGRNKHAAKSAAAEVALRHIVKYKKINMDPKVEEVVSNVTDESMEVTEEDVNIPIPWQHLASFALYKLFTSWGEDPDKARNEFIALKSLEPKTPKAPKALPTNAAEINPITLLNQMQPTAQYEEIGKTGNPPNVFFTIKCTVDNENFIGTGPSKKMAKKMAAYAACHKVYGIQYPTEVYPC